MNPVNCPHPSLVGSFRPLSAVALLSLFGGLTACDGSPTMPIDAPTQPAPLVMERVHPVETTVTASGVWVRLTVRVMGLHSRLPMADVPIRWWSTNEAVDFAMSPLFVLSSESLTLVTDQGGIATVLVRFRETGTAKISASPGGSDTGIVIFTITTTDPPMYVITFGPMFDCNETSSFWPENLSVPVGTVVEWAYPAGLHPPCTARIESVSVPTGATGFNSGLMYPGQRFQFVFQVPGTWTYVDAVNGGRATLTVTTSP